MITQVWGFFFLFSLSWRNPEQTVEASAYSHGPLHLKLCIKHFMTNWPCVISHTCTAGKQRGWKICMCKESWDLWKIDHWQSCHTTAKRNLFYKWQGSMSKIKSDVKAGLAGMGRCGRPSSHRSGLTLQQTRSLCNAAWATAAGDIRKMVTSLSAFTSWCLDLN